MADFRILVFGGTGTLGTALSSRLLRDGPHSRIGKTGVKYRFVGRRDVDLAEADAESRLERLFQQFKPNCVVNAAGYTKVLRKEAAEEKPYRVNYFGAGRIAATAAAASTVSSLVYISTDYCYPGSRGNYKEPSEIERNRPLESFANYYAYSKWLGELASIMFPRTLIIRTTFFPRYLRWPYPIAFTDQYTSRGSVAEVAGRIGRAIELFAKSDRATQYLNVAKDIRWSVYDMARHYYGDNIVLGYRHEAYGDSLDYLPADTSMEQKKFLEWIMTNGKTSFD